MGGLSIWHWIVVVVVVLLLFGRGKISELMGDLAKGIKSFKRGMAEDEAPAEPKTDAPVKTIDLQATPSSSPQSRTETEKKVG
jgi:sec-independent protein translocase protein TatA